MVCTSARLVVLIPLVALNLFAESGRNGFRGTEPPPPQKIEEVEGVEGGGLYLDGRVYIAGQPNEEALAALRREGLATVVNVRTPAEMEDRSRVPFDEARAVTDLGMAYVSIPLGGDDYPYGPEAVDRLAEILASSGQPVLIHCGYGGRAVYLWLAYLVQYENLPLGRALGRGEAMMLKPHAIARLLGRPTILAYAEDPAGESPLSEERTAPPAALQ
jgi:uncharacterized protein (TIGR01244 family)